MGTHYYVKPPDATSDDPDDWIHLGKSSAGWAFTFRGYPEAPAQTGGPESVTWLVNDYASWHRLLSLGEIFDEYGKPWTAEDLLVKIEGKRGGRHHGPAGLGQGFRDDDGNDFHPEGVLMTDIWCFTCDHELKRLPAGGYIHLDADDLDGCVCIDDEEECQPR